jgi:hypothetical protein
MRLILLMILAGVIALAACQLENRPITSQSTYRTYEGLPCRFNGADVKSINSAANLGEMSQNCCPHCESYDGKQGQTIHAAVNRPVYAIADMRLVRALNRSAVQRSGRMGNEDIVGAISTPFDDLLLEFVDTLGNKILYYHLTSNTPLVPGFGSGNCSLPLEWQTELWKQYPQNCGGVAQTIVNKGDIIGYVGSTGGPYSPTLGRVVGEHISIGITVSRNDPRFGGQAGMVVPSHNFTWENVPTDDPLKYLLPL